MMFRGVSELSLDDKGRIAIPSRYREPLLAKAKGACVITIDTQERCLLVYPLQEWEHIEKQIEALPSFDREVRRIQRLLIGHATEVALDGSGRILIAPPLRDYAQLQKNTVLIGQGRKFELWDANLWSAQREKWLEKDERQAEQPASLLSISL